MDHRHSNTNRQFDNVSDKETAELRDVCDRIAQQGGEAGEIARDIRKASDELDAISKKVKNFLAR